MKIFDFRKLLIAIVISVAIVDVVIILHKEKEYQTKKKETEVMLDSIVNILKTYNNNGD